MQRMRYMQDLSSPPFYCTLALRPSNTKNNNIQYLKGRRQNCNHSPKIKSPCKNAMAYELPGMAGQSREIRKEIENTLSFHVVWQQSYYNKYYYRNMKFLKTTSDISRINYIIVIYSEIILQSFHAIFSNPFFVLRNS